MNAIAPYISEFLKERLPVHRGASVNTCDSYAYAFQLLFQFASEKYEVQPYQLSVEQLDAQLIMAFLQHLETNRNNCPRTRNARLVAIKTFMKFIQYRIPSVLDQVQSILSIPAKKMDSHLVGYLTMKEIEHLLNQPNISTKAGIRDRSMIHLCFSAGLRVTELVELDVTSITLHASPSIHVIGKGRKERVLPIWQQTVKDLTEWISMRGVHLSSALFLNSHNERMTRSGFEYVLKKHAASAIDECPTLKGKKISPHVLRHSSAMLVLQATGDIRKVSLWLGHSSIQTTEAYLRADPKEKIEAIQSMIPPSLKPGKFKVPDKLMELLSRH